MIVILAVPTHITNSKDESDILSQNLKGKLLSTYYQLEYQ